VEKLKENKKRFHSFEFNEVSFLPTFMRQSTPEVLGQAIIDSEIYASVSKIFARFCSEAGCSKFLDLGSGSGKPVLSLISSLINNKSPVPDFILSDLYPNIAELKSAEEFYHAHISIVESPIDALTIPASLSHDALCMIASFHHFSVADALRILSGAVESNKPIFILEPITGMFKDSRSLGIHYTANFFKNPFTAKTNNIKKAIFTYLVPILPFVFLWDACISMARAYSEDEFYEMTMCLTSYTWGYLKIPTSRDGCVAVFYGIPK